MVAQSIGHILGVDGDAQMTIHANSSDINRNACQVAGLVPNTRSAVTIPCRCQMMSPPPRPKTQESLSRPNPNLGVQSLRLRVPGSSPSAFCSGCHAVCASPAFWLLHRASLIHRICDSEINKQPRQDEATVRLRWLSFDSDLVSIGATVAKAKIPRRVGVCLGNSRCTASRRWLKPCPGPGFSLIALSNLHL
jgi:hypothetical protein